MMFVDKNNPMQQNPSHPIWCNGDGGASTIYDMHIYESYDKDVREYRVTIDVCNGWLAAGIRMNE